MTRLGSAAALAMRGMFQAITVHCLMNSQIGLLLHNCYYWILWTERERRECSFIHVMLCYVSLINTHPQAAPAAEAAALAAKLFIEASVPDAVHTMPMSATK